MSNFLYSGNWLRFGVALQLHFIFGLLSVSAQNRFTTPDQPWTYVPIDSVPDYVRDTAYERRIYEDRFGRDPAKWEVRQIFYLHFHPELTVGDSASRLIIQIPREPGEVEEAILQNLDITSYTVDSTNSFITVTAGHVDPSETYPFIFTQGGCSYLRFPTDTVCSAIIERGPGLYNIVTYLDRDQGRPPWGLFVQWVDSLYHPPLTSNLDESPNPEAGAYLRTFPNPTSSGDIVHVDIPADWPLGESSSLRIYDITGQMIELRQIDVRAGETIQIPTPVASGTYAFTLYGAGGRMGWGRFEVR